jgi:nucleotide-binding universal stress UspA family protein
MKNILVTTDFSEAADNALEYALNLGAATGAAVIILNVYHIPLPAGQVPLMLVSPHEILEQTHERLKELAAATRTAYEHKFAVHSIARQGFAADEIPAAAAELKADLIVMGTTGTGSALATLLGSVTTEVMKRSSVPVLVIPASAQYAAVRQIAFAFDYQQPCERTTTLLKHYAELFGAELSIVNVVTPQTKQDAINAAAGLAMDDALATTPHRLYFLEGTDVLLELSRFSEQHHSDWLVVVPHVHGFFHALYHRSISKGAAMRIHIPVLSIHEQ